MDHPMRLYGLNVVEQVLDDVLVAVGALLAAFALVAGDPRRRVRRARHGGRPARSPRPRSPASCSRSAARASARTAARPTSGFALLAVAALGWIACGIVAGSVARADRRRALVALFALLVALRRRALRLRFKPRFLSLRKFDTMVQVADTMIDGDGREALDPIEVAVAADHLLDHVDSPPRRSSSSC